MIKCILQELIFDILLTPVLHLPLERIGTNGCKGVMDDGCVFLFGKVQTKQLGCLGVRDVE